jgi:DNA-binding CsgD family transcriptional regulator
MPIELRRATIKRLEATETTQNNSVPVNRSDLTASKSVHLSSRERDCLLWTAKGKSSVDIGFILGISESTVNFHIKNSMTKLGAATRTVAVVKAIQRGLIDPLAL